MVRTRYIYPLFSIICLMVLIFDGRCALEGASFGLDLCIRTVIPSLFPFFVLSSMLTTSLNNMDFTLLRQAATALKIPQSASAAIIPALLGGYPIGAKCVADLYCNGSLEKNEAERLLAFCSNAGPSFLFGMVSAFFPNRKMIWQLWGIHVLGAIITSFFFSVPKSKMPDKVDKDITIHKNNIMLSSLRAIALVCGWVVLFRMVINFLEKWFLWFVPPWAKSIIIGALELTNGCFSLRLIQDVSIRFVLCSCMLAFGGVCVLLQTAAVTKGLSLRNYFAGKSIQFMVSFLLSSAVMRKNSLRNGGIVLVLLVILIKVKNKYRNPQVFPV